MSDWFYITNCNTGEVKIFTEEWQASVFRDNENDTRFCGDREEYIVTYYPWSEPKPFKLGVGDE